MSKILLLVLAIGVVWWLIRGARRKQTGKPEAEAAPEQMVNCSHCGLYLPRSEAVPQGDRLFCSEEHRRLAG